MSKKKWIGDRGEEIDHDRLAIWKTGPAGRIIDKRNEDVGYDWEVHRYNIYTQEWDIERHETKTKSQNSKSYPSLTPNERRAREEYGDEYFVDQIDLPPYLEKYYDNFLDID